MDGKRRLPSWMAGVSASSKASKSVDTKTNEVLTEEASVAAKPTNTRSKSQTRRHNKEVNLPHDEAVEAEESSFLVKCETKRIKRVAVQKDLSNCDDSGRERRVENRKLGKVQKKPKEHEPARKKKAKNREFENKEETEDPSHDEDDLTMEDVLSIAKEFVKNDRDMGQNKPSQDHGKSKTQFADTSSAIAPRDTRSPVHEDRNFKESTSTEVTIVGSQVTDDPAQDMLDLFLGPLLKKPIGKEEKSLYIVDDVKLPNDAKKRPVDVGSDNLVALTKKKSSLRDTVAMLLE